MFKPLSIDATDTEEFKSILKDIEVLIKFSSKNDYVINYLDTYSTVVEEEYKVYHIVTDIYEVKFYLIIKK